VLYVPVRFSLRVLDPFKRIMHRLKADNFRYRMMTVDSVLKCDTWPKNAYIMQKCGNYICILPHYFSMHYIYEKFAWVIWYMCAKFENNWLTENIIFYFWSSHFRNGRILPSISLTCLQLVIMPKPYIYFFTQW
jgi:hypothetical protein